MEPTQDITRLDPQVAVPVAPDRSKFLQLASGVADVFRSTGMDDQFIHAVEVGNTAWKHGLPRDLVIAAFLHDTIELGIAAPQILAAKWGNRVASVVMTLTEQRDQPWIERKQIVLDRILYLHRGDRALDAASVFCCSKIGTIWLGARFAREHGGSIEGWSGGNIQQNLEHFNAIKLVCKALGVKDSLTQALDKEIEGFKKATQTCHS